MSLAIDLVERGVVPDALTRAGIRGQLRRRLRDQDGPGAAQRQHDWIAQLAASPIAVDQDAANRQHYAQPPRLFELMLGPRLKYSSCWWDDGVSDLAVAEEAMLARSCAAARLADGQRILEIGCGWGSLTLWMARRYPGARIVAISNSAAQRTFIEARLRHLGLTNATVLTCDVATFAPSGGFDRVVSVECFEHLRNWAELFRRIRGWLTPDGRLWMHVFCHRRHGYAFALDGAEDGGEGDGDWMARHFFTGGQMPAYDQPLAFDRDLLVIERQAIDGTHYQRTARAWLERLDGNRAEALAVLAAVDPDPRRAFNRWRVFLMSCEELWGYAQGREWLVGHYLLAPR